MPTAVFANLNILPRGELSIPLEIKLSSPLVPPLTVSHPAPSKPPAKPVIPLAVLSRWFWRAICLSSCSSCSLVISLAFSPSILPSLANAILLPWWTILYPLLTILRSSDFLPIRAPPISLILNLSGPLFSPKPIRFLNWSPLRKFSKNPPGVPV